MKERRKDRDNLGDIKVDRRIIEIYRENVASKFVDQFIGLIMRSNCGTCSRDLSLFSVKFGTFCDKVIYKPVLKDPVVCYSLIPSYLYTS